ncbi:phage baseplate protein [Paenibacillus sp. strain BS8-2]
MALLDGIYITVETEDPAFPVVVTEQPVEEGVDLTDHVQRQVRTLPLSGVIVGPDAAQIREYLVAASNTGKIVRYVGRNAFTGIITDLATNHDHTVANGFRFSFALREIRIARASPISQLPAPIRSQAAPIVNSGIKQTKTNAPTGKKGGQSAEKKVEKVKFVAGSPWAEGD